MSSDPLALARFLLESLYTGELNNGPAYPYQGLLLAPLGPGEADKMLRDEQERRLPQLLSHFGIDPSSPDCWRELALALAARHVPGFKWDYGASAEKLMSFGNLGLGTIFPGAGATPLKRGRGRPRKVRYGVGLLNMTPTKAKGRPVLQSIDEKREFVMIFAEWKRRSGLLTDHAVAERIARDVHPHLNSANIKAKASALVGRIKRFRVEVKKFDKSQEIQPPGPEFQPL